MASRAHTPSDPAPPRARASASLPRRPGPGTLALVAGRVVDRASGAALPGAAVTLAELGEHRAGPPPAARHGATAADGRFALPVPHGAGALLVTHRSGYLPEVHLVSRRTRHLVVALGRGGGLCGLVAGAGGGVQVTATSPDALDTAQAVTSRDGSFAIEGLRPGRYRVEAAGRPAALEVEVRAGEAATAELPP